MMKHYNVGLLCQFKDPEPYFAAFHAHHERLFDRIIYIDHGSKLEFSKLELAKTKFIFCNIQNFVKDITYSKVINQSIFLKSLDFLFILDVDEFLPFETQSAFHKFLHTYINYGTGTLNWVNGYPDRLKSLNSSPRIWIQTTPSPTKKLFYNLNKVKFFFPKEGNHNADYPLLGQTFLQLRPKRNKNLAPLIHLPIISDWQLKRKLEEYPEADFSNKLYHLKKYKQDTISLDIEKMVSDYRELKPRTHNFKCTSIFTGLNKQIEDINTKLANLPMSTATPEWLENSEVVKLRTKGFYRLRNLRRLIALRQEPSGIYIRKSSTTNLY